MSKEDPQQQDDDNIERPKDFRPHNLSLVVGDSGSESSSSDLQDMRSRMQSFAINAEDGGMPVSTIFVEDSDVIMPSTSQTGFSSQYEMGSSLARIIEGAQTDAEGIDMNNFVRDLFANDTRFLNSAGKEATETNFIEEIFTEKPPKILRDYLFGTVIGEGSYSKVKEVLHVKSLMRRAVKIIKDKRLRKIPGGDQNVQREIEVLQRLNHPNVVKVVDIFRIEEKQKLYIVMEFCVCSLQQMLDNCPEKMLPEFQANLYFTQLLDGLDFLHSKRIIHKDIKPGNLLLSLDGILKICDLGVAELLNSEAEGDWCNLVQGTPKFQPPEIVSGTQRKFRGSLVDIWACGVTLYNMVSGQYPFDGDVIMKLFENITNHPLEMPSCVELSAELQQLLQGMLQKEPQRRWDSLRIRTCKWFTKKHPVDNSRIVHIPPIKDIPAHRPLSVFHCLEQMYGNYEAAESGADAAEDENAQPSSIQDGMSTLNNRQPSENSNPQLDLSRLEDGQIRFEEEDGLLTAQNNPRSTSAEDDCGDGGISGDNNDDLQRRRQRGKITVARLRQILFIALCSLIVLGSVFVLILML